MKYLSSRYEHDEDIKLIDNPEIAIYARNGTLDTVKELLRHNADTSIKNNHGNTAFDYAEGKVKEYFISQGITRYYENYEKLL